MRFISYGFGTMRDSVSWRYRKRPASVIFLETLRPYVTPNLGTVTLA